MKRFDEVKTQALIGAIIGGGVCTFIAVKVMGAWFIVEAILIMGSGGGICGAICSVIGWRFSHRAIASVVGGVVGGIGGFFVIVLGMLWYSATPWPSPEVYPGVEVTINEGSPGSWGLAQTRSYVVDSSLDEVQGHYESQMGHYCKEEWQFKIELDCDKYASCREARCEITRLWAEQFFEVHLYAVSESQTRVIQVDRWED